MKRLWVTALALLLFASGTGAGYLAQQAPLPQAALTVQGHLGITAFRGCQGDADKMSAALAQYMDQSLAKVIVTNLFSVREAIAGPPQDCHVFAMQSQHNRIIDGGETALRDCFNNNASSSCTANIAAFNFHGIGTLNTADAEADTGCGTEVTTNLNPDNTRATGTRSTPASNQFRTVGTNTVDGTVAAIEWCLFNQAATGGGTAWSHVAPFAGGVINLASGDSIQTTYTLTID